MPEQTIQLHPATLHGLARMRELYDTPPTAERRHTYVEPVYPCPICGDEHDREDDALDCCQKDEPATDRLAITCPVCRTEHSDSHEAAHCCLWHDLTWLQRYLIGNAVEAGATWPDAIDMFKATNPASTP